MKEYADFYFRKAKADNYPARSVYKLKELDSKYRLLSPGMKALDLGASPGSWSMGAAEKIGSSGLILACDLKALAHDPPAPVEFMQADIFAPTAQFLERLEAIAPFDLVMSDMAPATTGNKFTDQCRSLELAERAFEIARQYLREGGNFVVKIFMGPDVQAFQASMRPVFEQVKIFKPKSSRSESKETFLLGISLKKLN